MLIYLNLNLVIRKGFLPRVLSFTQPCQQGFNIGDRFWNLHIFFIPARHIGQPYKIEQLYANPAIGTCSPALASFQIIGLEFLQIRLSVPVIVHTQFVQAVPGIIAGITIVKAQLQ